MAQDAEAQGDARGIQHPQGINAKKPPQRPSQAERGADLEGNEPSTARLNLWAERSDAASGEGAKPERVALYASDSPWASMHRLAASVSLTSESRQHVNRIVLDDTQRQLGATASRNEAGEWELSFTNDDSRALYRQAVRERQMELARPAENSLGALPAAAERTSRKSRSPDEAAADRSELQALLDSRDAQGNRPRQQLEFERQVIQHANSEQIMQLKLAAKDNAYPAAWDKAVQAVQAQIERAAGLPERSSGNPEPAGHPDRTGRRGPETREADDTNGTVETLGAGKRTLPQNHQRDTPPVDERFTVSPRLVGNEYWFRDRPDRLAFTETWLSLRTAEHSSAALMGMVDRARELGWKTVHLQGSAEFKREAWVLVTSRGMQAMGYTPTQGDREAAAAEQRRQERRPDQQTQIAKQVTRQQRRVDLPAQPERKASPQSQRPVVPDLDQTQWRAVLQKAMKDARVPPQLEGRLMQALEQRGRQRGPTGQPVRFNVWDAKAPKLERGSFATGRERGKERPRER